jgi:hypothetical protein
MDKFHIELVRAVAEIATLALFFLTVLLWADVLTH